MAGIPAVPPPPPRFTGNGEEDLPAMVQYLDAFYRAAVTEGYFANQGNVNASIQASVDPVNATAATAQNTANTALSLAAIVDTRTKFNLVGTATVTGAATTAVVALTITQPDTNYQVAFGGDAFTGTPAAAAFVVVAITKTNTQFTLTLAAAPGVGNSVTLGWLLAR